MLGDKKALLLIGSPKKKNSTSESLADYVLKKLHNKGYTTEKLHVVTILKNDREELIDKVEEADLLVMAFPLYVDMLPAPLIRALELIGDSRKGKNRTKEQGLVAISNCGFPEAFHNQVAIEVCKSFANKAGFKWLGGLAMGAGGSINGRSIKDLGGMTRNIIRALDSAANAISKNKCIPSETIDMMSGKLMPIWLYLLFGNRSWKTHAKAFGMEKNLYAQPYMKE